MCLIMPKANLKYSIKVLAGKEIKIMGKVQITVFRTSNIAPGAQCKRKMAGVEGVPWSKCIKNFQMLTAEHETKRRVLQSPGPYVSTQVTHP